MEREKMLTIPNIYEEDIEQNRTEQVRTVHKISYLPVD